MEIITRNEQSWQVERSLSGVRFEIGYSAVLFCAINTTGNAPP
jgi:hypothetical protein